MRFGKDETKERGHSRRTRTSFKGDDGLQKARWRNTTPTPSSSSSYTTLGQTCGSGYMEGAILQAAHACNSLHSATTYHVKAVQRQKSKRKSEIIERECAHSRWIYTCIFHHKSFRVLLFTCLFSS